MERWFAEMSKYMRSSKNYLYTAWLGMVRRCTVETHPAYKWYGARGITICYRWRESFAAFVNDMGERPSPRHSLDRIDNDRGYDLNNCRWATHKQQAANRRRPKTRKSAIRVGGLTLTELSHIHGIKRATMKWRYANGKRGAELISKDLRAG